MGFDLTAAVVDVPLVINNCISWPTTIVCLLCVYSLGLYHALMSRRWFQSSNSRPKTPKIDFYFSFIMLLVSAIYLPLLINMTYSETVSLHPSYCIFVVFSCTALYTSFKTSMYIVMVLRLHVIFQDGTVVNYPAKWLNLWTFTLCLWALGSNTLSAFTTNAYVDKHGVCAFEWSAPFLVSVVMNDMSAGAVFGYLFITPILVISRKVDGDLQKIAALNLKRVAVKQFLLSIVATGSTLIGALFVYLFHLTQVFAAIDVVVSSLSIILMYQWHSGVYDKCLCRKCERYFLQDDKHDANNIVEIVNDQSGTAGTQEITNGN